MTIDLAILSAPVGGTRLPVATNDASDVTFSDGVHGDEQLTATLPRTLVEGMAVYEAPVPQVVVSEHGAQIASYRLEQPAISDAQLQLTALGASRAFSDATQTALWSMSAAYDGWRETQPEELASRLPERFAFDTTGKLFISPEKNSTQGTTAPFCVGALTYVVPDGGARTISGISFDYVLNAPVNWQGGLQNRNADFSGGSTLWSVTSAGALLQGTVHLVIGAPLARLEFYLLLNTASVVFAGESGDTYLKITNLRIVTSTTNRINTTLTAARAAGTNVTATVGSTARMYVGQQLQINAGATPSETVTVLSIGSSTQFNATFANAYAIGNAVQAHVVYPDEVVRDLLAGYAAFNLGQLSSNAVQVQTCPQDQTDYAYADQTADAIFTDLEARTGYRWAVRNRLLSFAPVGTNAQTWYVDASNLEVQRALDDLANRYYAVYRTAAGDTVRGAAANNVPSHQRFGLIRQRTTQADTTNAAVANAQRDRDLAASATPTPQAKIAFDAIYTAQGARVPPWMVRADDTLIIRNLPPQAAQSRDKIRALLLTRRELNLDDGSITVEAQPLETIERLIGKTTA